MNTVFKNCTDTILVISDINIKFQPKGRRGDTLDLSKFLTVSQIKNSVDLTNAVKKRYLYSMGKDVKAPMQAVPVAPNGRNPHKSKQPQMFIVHNPNLGTRQ